MKQSVTVVLLADRHAEAHTRQFADAFSVEVEAGPLTRVLIEAVPQLLDMPVGRYTLSVSEPYE